MTESKETLTLLIKGIEEKKASNGSTFWKVDTDVRWFGLWDPAERSKLVVGEEAECETETKGKYHNIIKVLSSKPPEKPAEKPAEKTADKPWTNRHSAEERASIEAQVAFKGAVELLVNKVVPPDDALMSVARAWIYERLCPELAKTAGELLKRLKESAGSPPPLLPKATAPALKEAAEKTGAVAIPEPWQAQTSGAVAIDEPVRHFATSGVFFTAIKDDFGLGVTNLSPEIKELVNKHEYEAAYRVIKGKRGA